MDGGYVVEIILHPMEETKNRDPWLIAGGVEVSWKKERVHRDSMHPPFSLYESLISSDTSANCGTYTNNRHYRLK
jgi:hypothetical protein